MRRSIPIVLAATLALGAVAAGEGEDLTDHECYDPATGELAYAEQQVWFHESDAKLGNVAAAAPWDTTAPADSVTDGAGAGAALPGHSDLAAETPVDQRQTFTGTFNGCIDDILVDLYFFNPQNRASVNSTGELSDHAFRYTLVVDGVELIDSGQVQGASTFTNEGAGPNLNRFSIGVGAAMERSQSWAPELRLDGEHTIELTVAPWYVNTGHAVYVWDTSEVPSGITFNGLVTDDYPTVG